MFTSRFDKIIASTTRAPGIEIGFSREGRPIFGFTFGTGEKRISLLAGCHADEPVGPKLLRCLVSYLSSLSAQDEMLRKFTWHIIPQLNPDGEHKNSGWIGDIAEVVDIHSYITKVIREEPGDDIEFGFPRGDSDTEARPENRAAYHWWKSLTGPFSLHASLHGMAFAGGPWFLVDENWMERIDHLKLQCKAQVAKMGYQLHDIDRKGEKGFSRIERGFCTRPNSRAMSEFFRSRGDQATANLFRPSSMEAIRTFGGDPLTLVSEMPLFIVRGMGENIYPNDPVAERWKKVSTRAREAMRGARPKDLALASEIERLFANGEVYPMLVRDQLELQWTFICAGIEVSLA